MTNVTQENSIQNIDDEPHKGSEFMTCLEASIYLRLLKKDGSPNPNQVRVLVNQGRLPFYKPFGRLLFKKSELDKIVNDTKKGGYKIGY